MTLLRAAGITATALAAFLTACTGTARPTRVDASPAPSRSDSVHVARASADSARYPYTAADVRFMAHMIGHHGQAVLISRWAPTHGASAAIRTLAARIINAQHDEIAAMQRWLRERRQLVPDENAPTRMTMNGVEHEMLMPGMLSGAQMTQLDAARGAEFDRLFLTLMIQHHKGAVSMVEDLFGTSGAAQDETVFRLASDVNVDQITEIARMENMLRTLTPPQLTPR